MTSSAQFSVQVQYALAELLLGLEQLRSTCAAGCSGAA